MIVRAALCPSPPLLAADVTGQDMPFPDLRDACADAVAWLLAAEPATVALIGPASASAGWPPDSAPDLAMHAPGAYPGPSTLPLSLAIGSQLLDAAGYSGPRILRSVAQSAPPDVCFQLGRDLAAQFDAVPFDGDATARVALLVLGDGSARRSAAAPGYLDQRAEPFDLAVERAFRDGDLPALTDLDPGLARDLLAAGRPAWQVLAGALSSTPARSSGLAVSSTSAPSSTSALSSGLAPSAGSAPPGRPRTEILYSDAPLGVAYLVATLTPAS